MCPHDITISGCLIGEATLRAKVTRLHLAGPLVELELLVENYSI